jgi:hypothetical protein
MEAASAGIHWEALLQRFGKGRPDAVRSIEEMAAAKQAKKQAKKGPSKASISSGPAANIRQ